MGVASLVLGILSIVLGVFGGISSGWLGAIIGIIGIILGVQAQKKFQNKKGIASAGFVCSVIGTILSLHFLCGVCSLRWRNCKSGIAEAERYD